jgi:hypothetical protein
MHIRTVSDCAHEGMERVWKYLQIYVMYVCMYACMPACMHTFVYMYAMHALHTGIRIYVCNACMHAYVDVWVGACAHVRSICVRHLPNFFALGDGKD